LVPIPTFFKFEKAFNFGSRFFIWYWRGSTKWLKKKVWVN
jgi:hypothetical protein